MTRPPKSPTHTNSRSQNGFLQAQAGTGEGKAPGTDFLDRIMAILGASNPAIMAQSSEVNGFDYGKSAAQEQEQLRQFQPQAFVFPTPPEEHQHEMMPDPSPMANREMSLKGAESGLDHPFMTPSSPADLHPDRRVSMDLHLRDVLGKPHFDFPEVLTDLAASGPTNGLVSSSSATSRPQHRRTMTTTSSTSHRQSSQERRLEGHRRGASYAPDRYPVFPVNDQRSLMGFGTDDALQSGSLMRMTPGDYMHIPTANVSTIHGGGMVDSPLSELRVGLPYGAMTTDMDLDLGSFEPFLMPTVSRPISGHSTQSTHSTPTATPYGAFSLTGTPASNVAFDTAFDSPATAPAPAPTTVKRGRGRPKGQRNKKSLTSEPPTPGSGPSRRSTLGSGKMKGTAGPAVNGDALLTLGEPAIGHLATGDDDDGAREGERAGSGSKTDARSYGERPAAPTRVDSDSMTRTSKLRDGLKSGSSSVLASPTGPWQSQSPRKDVERDRESYIAGFPSTRKTTHKYAEQRRRDDLKKWFGRLRTVVPALREAVAEFRMTGENGDNVSASGMGTATATATASPPSPVMLAAATGGGDDESDEDGYVGRKGAAIRGASKLECLEKTYEYILALRQSNRERQDENEALRKMLLELGGDPTLLTRPRGPSSVPSTDEASMQECDRVGGSV